MVISEIEIARNCLCAKLRATSRVVTKSYEMVLQEIGLSANQFTILTAVKIMQPVSITSLSEELSMDRTTLSRNIKPLHKAGFLELSDGYGRTRELCLSILGKKTLEDAKPLWEQAQSKMLIDLGSENSELLSKVLDEFLTKNK